MTAEATIAERTYTIGELAAISGLSVHALRWYEAQGLFPRDIPRTPGGQRIFGDEAVRWLALLNRLRDSAMPVADMARYSQLVRAGEGNEADRIALMESHARSLDAQIEELIASREVIRDKITFYRQAVASRT
ncbi:MerR family transcriptional regulator [Cryobacterium zhongshanensis]|uniref:MerR family transcriptional regulator n=1 Tax=Cryobacterium zhongshanensis TaxID=2928153 RepID=A0AA41QWA2_9MICO|nr:MerR family transcriptional regulator [Cryobacterium zhongshanensis]MCI4658293.1 MerR family transcriptional regulator [Cryobacterium zhongshanensis]